MEERFDRDTELMLRFQAGDESCFEQLVDRHKQRVFGLVYRFLGGGSDVEDIAQEILVRVYRARKTYRPSAKFTTWLYTICRNTCFKEYRKRRLVLVSDETGQMEDDIIYQMPDMHTPSPSESALRDEQALVVKAAIDSLPEAQRMALILRKYEQLSYQEIAQAMACSPKAVRSLLYRARGNLKEQLAGYMESDRSSETSGAGRGLSQ